VGTFNATLHPRGPNGRFTRSFARHMSSLDGVKAKKVKAGFHAHTFHGPDDAHTYLGHLSGVKTPGKAGGGGGIRQYLDNGTLKTANEALRAGKTDNPAVHAIDATMKPLPDDLQLFRSVPASKFGKVDPKSLEGMLVSDAGYFPATVAPQKGGPGTVQLHVQAPAGTKAAVDPDSGQVVLGHGAEMAVDSVDVAPDGSTRMNLVALPEQTPSGVTASADAGSAPFDSRLAAALSSQAALDSVPSSFEEEDPNRTPEQNDALFNYLNAGFIEINRQLRDGQFNPNTRIEEWVRGLDSVMDQSHLPHDVQAWRGVSMASRMFGDRLNGDMTGMEWREDAYSSTSTDRTISEDFATDGEEPVLMRLVVPAGTGALRVSGAEQESEILLERGVRMRVVADRGVDARGIRQLDIEVIPT